MCNQTPHTCSKDCQYLDALNCAVQCRKLPDHEGACDCGSGNHLCGQPCGLQVRSEMTSATASISNCWCVSCMSLLMGQQLLLHAVKAGAINDTLFARQSPFTQSNTSSAGWAQRILLEQMMLLQAKHGLITVSLQRN